MLSYRAGSVVFFSTSMPSGSRQYVLHSMCYHGCHESQMPSLDCTCEIGKYHFTFRGWPRYGYLVVDVCVCERACACAVPSHPIHRRPSNESRRAVVCTCTQQTCSYIVDAFTPSHSTPGHDGRKAEQEKASKPGRLNRCPAGVDSRFARSHRYLHTNLIHPSLLTTCIHA